MNDASRPDLGHDLILPTLLFAVLGAMTWAIRGCSGFGAVNGCVFAGVTWGAAWWFLAHEPAGRQSRPYASGWIILALTVGIGMAGNRGWMQWPTFFDGRLQTNTPAGEWVPIPRRYGFLWLFIAGVPWAGLGACALAWCGSHRPAGRTGWCLRILCGLGAAWLAQFLFDHLPEVFLPLYKSLRAQYADRHAYPNLHRLINDNRAAITHLGLYLGLLLFEAGRKNWRGVKLILTVGLANGLGWAACQNWRWAARVWPRANFNFWRCWESSGGISIGLAYGLAFYWVNRPLPQAERARLGMRLGNGHPDLERFGAYLGLLLGLGLSIKNGLKGWANLYLGNEEHWDRVLWRVTGPLLLLGLAAVIARIRSRSIPRGFESDLFPHAYGLMWLVLIVQNLIAQLVTGPLGNWNEAAFSIYYVLLFLISAAIVYHYEWIKRHTHVRGEGEAAGAGGP